MFRNYFLLRLMLFGASLILTSHLPGQETNGRASGKVISDSNEIPAGVTVTLIHEPTQNKYVAVTQDEGNFYFFHLKPGGPYSIIFSSAGYETFKKNQLFIYLRGEHFLEGNTELSEFVLEKKVVGLSEVVVTSRNANGTKTGLETNITSSTLRAMPSISRNFQDFVRMVPQAKVTGDGSMSLAGQNNRFNAFFIDGANNNDVQGLAVNGMNGGQTGSPPVSMEAIEEINVLLAPYDVQYGNFTGGSINAITRSGGNENKSSVWYYFRNEDMAGRSPQVLPKPGFPGEYHRPHLSSFFNQTFGTWNSGALVRNKLFYFVLLEKQSDVNPQPFNFNVYRGNSSQEQLFALQEFLMSTYQYNPGSFLETNDELDATRVNLKFDWNLSLTDKFSLSYRYNNSERTTPRIPSGAITILFQNNGIRLPIQTHTATFEWNRFFNRKMNNRLLITYTNQVSDRNWLGQPFPAVNIRDGDGIISFGSDLATGVNNFKANDFTLFNSFKWVEKKHVMTAGADINYATINTRYIPTYFGLYTYRNLNEFMNSTAPARLERLFPLSDESGNPTKYHTLRSSLFLNDELRPNTKLKLNFGIRLDINSIPSTPNADKFFNDTAISIISRHYDLAGATSGKMMQAHWNLSPRIGADYKLSKADVTLRAGAGVFLGHIVNIWPSDVFNSINGSIDIVPKEFIPDPYGQPTSESLNLNPADYMGALSLVAKNFKYPSVFRSSITAEKKTKNNWTFSIEGIFTKNIHDASFRNINIEPPVLKSAMPDSRNIYSLNTMPSKIELKTNGVKNPYTNVTLLANNQGRKGYSYSLSFILQKQANNFSFNCSYTYGRSQLLFEITGPQTPISSQWRNMETVNGRNFVTLSVSDNDLQHRITAWASQKFNYAKGMVATTVSLFYNGQSGFPYSYVYNRSMINDNGRAMENFDLIYIPTEDDLASMNFVPITTPVPYSPQEQKDFLNGFIETDKYLKKHRGEFAERNAARLPFTHVIDLRLQQDFIIKIKQKVTVITISYDVFNFTNMINKDWGRIYSLSTDSYPLIRFADYASTTPDIIPQYQATPFIGKPYSLQSSTLPGSSARWISQLGIKITLN